MPLFARCFLFENKRILLNTNYAALDEQILYALIEYDYKKVNLQNTKKTSFFDKINHIYILMQITCKLTNGNFLVIACMEFSIHRRNCYLM